MVKSCSCCLHRIWRYSACSNVQVWMLSERVPGHRWQRLSSVLYSSLDFLWLSSRSLKMARKSGPSRLAGSAMLLRPGDGIRRCQKDTQMADIAIVGGEPSGGMCGEQLARAGHTVELFDEHLAWEKPCGGGLTHKAIQCFP